MSLICAEDFKLTKKAKQKLENVPVIGDVKAAEKKTKIIKKTENWKLLKQKKGANKGAYLVKKSDEKPNVVHISEIKPTEVQCPSARRSTSLIGKKLHQNLSANLFRTDYIKSSSAIGNQTRKSRQNAHDSNIKIKLWKTLRKSDTERNVDASKKSTTILPKSRTITKAKLKGQEKDDPDKQSLDYYPFTAPSFGHRYSEDLKTEFKMRLADFVKRFSCSSDKTSCHVLFQNGQTIEFGKDWVERHIERYILLLMHQKLRALTAKEMQTKSSSKHECKEKLSYPLFNSVLCRQPEESNAELRQKIGFMAQDNIYQTTGYFKTTLYNRKLLKQREVNPLKVLSQTPNKQHFFNIKNLFDIDKLLSNGENKRQRSQRATVYKKRSSAKTKKKDSSTLPGVDSNKNEPDLRNTFSQQNYKTMNTIYKFRFTVHRNKKTHNEPAYKFPNLPDNIYTSVHPRPFVPSKSIPTNDRDYEIIKIPGKNTPAYLQTNRFEKKLLTVRFPVKKRQYCKLLTVQNLDFEPDSSPLTNKS